MDATELLQGYPVIPVVVIDDVSVSVRLASERRGFERHRSHVADG
jgi:hypothetical protein